MRDKGKKRYFGIKVYFLNFYKVHGYASSGLMTAIYF